MLYLPEGDPYYRIASIDPGSDNLGVCIIELNLITREPRVIYVETFRGSRGIRNIPEFEETHGTRQAKLHYHQQNLETIFRLYRPNVVISEAPYMGRFAQAFEALVECLAAIRSAMYAYDPSLNLETIDPPNVKKAVGAPGRGGDKEVVKKALMKLTKLTNASGLDLNTLDEHSIDSIAVGCYKLKCIGVDLF